MQVVMSEIAITEVIAYGALACREAAVRGRVPDALLLRDYFSTDCVSAPHLTGRIELRLHGAEELPNPDVSASQRRRLMEHLIGFVETT